MHICALMLLYQDSTWGGSILNCSTGHCAFAEKSLWLFLKQQGGKTIQSYSATCARDKMVPDSVPEEGRSPRELERAAPRTLGAGAQGHSAIGLLEIGFTLGMGVHQATDRRTFRLQLVGLHRFDTQSSIPDVWSATVSQLTDSDFAASPMYFYSLWTCTPRLSLQKIHTSAY